MELNFRYCDCLLVTQHDGDKRPVTNVPAAPLSCMEDSSGLRVPDTGQQDTLSLRSAHRRLELLHDVVSIRSDRSRHTRRSRATRSVQLPPKKTVWRRFKDVFRTVIAFVFSNVGICVLVLVYLILGEISEE